MNKPKQFFSEVENGDVEFEAVEEEATEEATTNNQQPTTNDQPPTTHWLTEKNVRWVQLAISLLLVIAGLIVLLRPSGEAEAEAAQYTVNTLAPITQGEAIPLPTANAQQVQEMVHYYWYPCPAHEACAANDAGVQVAVYQGNTTVIHFANR